MSPKQNAFQKGFQIKASRDGSSVPQALPLQASFTFRVPVAVVSLGLLALSAQSQMGFRGKKPSQKLLREGSVKGSKQFRCGGHGSCTSTQPEPSFGVAAGPRVPSPTCTLPGDGNRKPQADVSTVRIQGRFRQGLTVYPRMGLDQPGRQ